MKARVSSILKLLRDEAISRLTGELPAPGNGSLHSCFVSHILNLTAERFNQFHFLDCEPLGNAEDNTIASRDSHKRQSNTGVTGGRFNDCCARLEYTPLFGVEDHSQSCTILHRAARIKPLEFCKDICSWRRHETR